MDSLLRNQSKDGSQDKSQTTENPQPAQNMAQQQKAVLPAVPRLLDGRRRLLFLWSNDFIVSGYVARSCEKHKGRHGAGGRGRQDTGTVPGKRSR